MRGNQLKMLAIISMAIDHIAYVFMIRGSLLYIICRSFGRIAFPIFCFLISEGIHYTRSRTKYLSRLAAFALISELPFDLAFKGKPIEIGSQNVLFTLFLGVLGICAYEFLAERVGKLALFAPLICVLAAELIHTDYGAFGVLMITMCYMLRNYPHIQIGGIVLVNMLITISSAPYQIFGCAAVLPIFLYNGLKGNGGKFKKYFFYAFYPIHLTVIWIVSLLVY